MNRARGETLAGITAIATFGIYGLFPLYFKLIGEVPALEVLAHRIVWSVLFLYLLIRLLRHHIPAWRLARIDHRVLPWLALSALLIGTNWGVFVWAVQTDRVLESSLAYYIVPLANVLLGVLFLGEQLNLARRIAVTLAAAGTLNLVVAGGEVPWIALSLAFTFAFYGLVRKRVQVDSVSGLLVETAILLPLALCFMLWAWAGGSLEFGSGHSRVDALLIVLGIVSAAPLVAFAFAVRHLPLSVIAFFQYITPTVHLLLAVFVFGEPFTLAHGVTFILIWTAIILLVLDLVRRPRQRVDPCPPVTSGTNGTNKISS